MFRRWASPTLLAMALAVALILAVACGGDGGGSAEDRAEVEQAVKEVAGYGAADVDAFLERVTDKVLEDFFGFTREACKEDPQGCVGDPAEAISLVNTKVSGDTATTEGTVTFGGEEGGEETFLLSLVREDGKWKLDGLKTVPKEIPGGVKKVDLELNEFAFGFNASEITDGNFAFVVKNIGKQNHQVVVARVPADLDLEKEVRSEEQTQGVEDITFQGPFRPGEDGTVVFDQPLKPGRYALVCFLPDTDDPEKQPHAFKGMIGEFTIE